MILKSDAEFEGNPTCGLENDMRPEYLRVSKLGLSWDPFVQSRKCMSLKFTEELCVMTMKNDTKIEQELTCRFKIDMRNFTNFDASTRKSKKFVF